MAQLLMNTIPLISSIFAGPKGAKATVELMNSYNLTREDWDSLHDLSQVCLIVNIVS